VAVIENVTPILRAAGAALASRAIAQSASLGEYPMPAQITNLTKTETDGAPN
jgi:hypothetical protein